MIQSLRLRSLLSLLLMPVLVIGLGFLGFKGAVWFIGAVNNGFLAGWISLGTPPGKAVFIEVTAEVTATNQVIRKTIVKTADGKFYAYLPGPKTWVETTWDYAEKADLQPVCPGFDRPRPSLPHKIIDCDGSFNWEWFSTEDFYAVLDDGSVWRWRFGMGFLEILLLMVTVPILGGMGGFFLSKSVRKFILQNNQSP